MFDDNKTYAVMDIFYQLMTNKKVSTEYMLSKYKKDSRTLQRYMAIVKAFIKQMERNIGIEEENLSQIVYSKKDKVYYLDVKHISEEATVILSLLIQIKSLTPYLSIETKSFFEKLKKKEVSIREHHIIDHAIEYFEVVNEYIPEDLFEIQKIIDLNKKMNISFYDTEGHMKEIKRVKPLNIVYQYYNYYLIYEHKHKIKNMKIIDIIEYVAYQSDHFDGSISKDPIVLEIDRTHFDDFKKTYQICRERVNKINENKRVEINISREDAFYICYQSNGLVKIVEPTGLVEDYKNKLKLLLDQY
ncbi:hypothetical protein RW115_11820 [Macrococcus capreoli]